MDDDSARAEQVQAIATHLHGMASAALHRREADPWLDLDVTLKQLKVLMLLATEGPLRPGEIAAAVGVSAASATGILDRLVDQGYVERGPDPADRRAQRVQLTPSGAARVAALHAARQQQLHDVLHLLSDEDLAALHQGIAALAHASARTTVADVQRRTV